ncbi:MAG: hypothetical protein K0S80_4821 [Neobacillus sp.]|jgi:hypothetical protein|nr:hypothetical protein [Neobacillus sp.]
MDKQQIIDEYFKLEELSCEGKNDQKLLNHLRTLDTDSLQQLLTMTRPPEINALTIVKAVFAGGAIIGGILAYPTLDNPPIIIGKILFILFFFVWGLFWILSRIYELSTDKRAKIALKHYTKSKVQTSIMFVLCEKYKSLS